MDTFENNLRKVLRKPKPPEYLAAKVLRHVGASSNVNEKATGLMFRRRTWLVAGMSMAAIIILLANTPAFSRKLNRPTYTVDSEIRHYLADSVEDVTPASEITQTVVSPSMTLLVTSYNQDGREVIAAASFPDHPLKSIMGNMFLSFFGGANRFTQALKLSADESADAFAVVDPSTPRNTLVVGQREALLSSGCQTMDAGSKVVGQEVILNYPVIGVQQPHDGGMRMLTLWMAPELDCFSLRTTIHAKQSHGTWKLISEKQARRVTLNR